MAEARTDTREEITVQGVSGDSFIVSEVSEEFSLPDYIPEVRRILATRSAVLPESRFIQSEGSASRLDLGGTVTYSVIYTDDEGEIRTLPLSSAYEGSGQINSQPETVLVFPTVEGVNVRVNGPRKLTIKSRVKSRVIGIEGKEIGERVENRTVADEMFIQRRERELGALSLIPFSLQGIKASDKLDTQKETGLKPIWCDATLVTSDVKTQSNAISVKGELRVKCLCRGEDGEITLTKTIPVSEEISKEGIMQGDIARAGGRIVSLSISNEEGEGDIFIDATMEIEGEVSKNKTISLTTDMYSTKNEMTTEYRTEDIFSLAKTDNTPFTVNEGIKRKSNEIEELITLIADPVYEKTDIKGQKAIVNGKLLVKAIGRGKGDKERMGEYVADIVELPFKYGVDLPKPTLSPIVLCDMSLGEISGRYDKDKFYITAQIHPSLTILDRERVEILDKASVKKDEEIKKDQSCIRAYYPKQGESLWDIAKKYHTTTATLKELNSLEGDTVKSPLLV